jgi:DNA-binding winged helix-turn-helix (wHTH) protein/Tol biopolymer transport system component
MIGAPTKVHFGSFEFDFALQELRKRGMRVRLPVSQLRLLTLFLEKPGCLITREEIVSRLWKDPHSIDVSNGVNSASNRLRTELNDDPAKPIYIDTVIGLGYRFIAKVEHCAEPIDGEKGRRARDVTSDPATSLTQPEAPMPIAISGGALVNIPLTASFASERPFLLPPVDAEAPSPAPLPSPPSTPAPRRMSSSMRIAIVLFVLLGLATGTAVWQYRERMTSKAEKATEIAPVEDNLVLATFNDGDNRVTAEALSPQGEMFAYSDNNGVSVKWPDANSERRIPAPSSFSVRHIAWYPDAQRLAISGNNLATHAQQVWQIFMDGSPPRKLADDSADLATVSVDGKWLAYTRLRGTEIDISAADGSHPRKLITAGEGDSFAFLLRPPDGKSLVAERVGTGRMLPSGAPVTRVTGPPNALEALNQWTYESVDAVSGKVLASQDGIAFESGYFLADRRLFYVAEKSPASSQRACLMTVPTDPHTGRLLAAPRCARRFAGNQPKSLSASTDGTEYALVLDYFAADIFAADLRLPEATLENVIQVSHNSAESYPHGWTPRGDAVLLENNTLGKTAIFEQKLDRHNSKSLAKSGATLLARLPSDAVMPEFSPDGTWVLFLELSGHPARLDAILRVSASGGEPEQVPTTGTIEEFHCSISARGTCVLREAIGKTEFVYYALDPVKGMGKELARTAWQPNLLGDWSVSPDGTMIAVANHDTLHPGVQLIDITVQPESPICRSMASGRFWEPTGHPASRRSSSGPGLRTSTAFSTPASTARRVCCGARTH